jgi:hypothetical protein
MVEVGSKLVEQFAANLAKLITGDSPADTGASGNPAAAGGNADGASVPAASAPAATADGQSGNGSGGAASTAAGTVVGPTASATATASTSGAGAPAQEDSLNLVKLVGPALLKRLVPVAAGAAGLALLGRLFWRLRHRRQGKASAKA